MTFGDRNYAVKAKTAAFGNFIDPDRELFDAPNMALVEVDVPEYARNGLGRCLLKVVRYHFEDIDKHGVEGLSIGADSSRGHMIYSDMNPVVVGHTHSEAQAHAGTPDRVLKALYQRHYPMELVTLGALRHAQFDGDIDKLAEFVESYHRRASWMETHPVEVRFQNIEAQSGEPMPFDWESILSKSG